MSEEASTDKKSNKKTAFQKNKAGRLYVKAVFTSYRRGHKNQHENTAILRIDGVLNKKDTRFYWGKRCVYVYKARTARKRPHHDSKSRVRVIWGKITGSHGNSGAVTAKFRRNLPGSALAKRIRVMLYPSNI